MNKFRNFFNGLNAQKKIVFANRCGTSVGRLRNIAYGFSSPSVGLALIIESESKGEVTLKDLRPNDWFKYPIPELAEPKQEV